MTGSSLGPDLITDPGPVLPGQVKRLPAYRPGKRLLIKKTDIELLIEASKK